MRESFTLRAKQVARVALERAEHDGRRLAGSDDLLLAILSLNDPGLMSMLPDCHRDQSRLDRDGRRLRSAELCSTKDAVDAWLTREGYASVESGLFVVASLSQKQIEVEHLLVGIIDQPEGLGGKLLRSCCADCAQVRARLIAQLSSPEVSIRLKRRPWE